MTVSATELGALAFAGPALERELRAGLGRVEAALRESVKSPYPFVTETSQHLVLAGGKRFRPLLVLLASHFGDPDAPGIVPASVVVELTHLATLYHDDVMDEALLRRGTASANSRWGNTIAILTGDFLFARASDILADLGPECVRLQARTFERLVQGQIRETIGPVAGQDPVEHYLGVVADKTGSLIGTCARFGAMLSGVPEAQTDVLARYGERIGVAFQLSDDLLDVASDTPDSGKTPGTDLREGIPTLPTLLATGDGGDGGDARGGAASADDLRLRQLLSQPLTDDASHAEALALLRVHPAMQRARQVLRDCVDDALTGITTLPDGPARQALVGLAEFVMARTG